MSIRSTAPWYSRMIAPLRVALSHLWLRIWLGLILVSIVMIALVHLGIELSTYLGQLEHGLAFKAGFFILLAAGGTIGLWILFRPARPESIPPQAATPSTQTPDSLNHLATTLAIRFAEGFLTAVNTRPDRHHPENPAAETDRDVPPNP